jgi:hypothetical protein
MVKANGPPVVRRASLSLAQRVTAKYLLELLSPPAASARVCLADPA